MGERREHPELTGIADQDVEPAIAFVEGRRQFVDLCEIAQVEGHERGAAATGTNGVVELFEAADRARSQHDMRAFAGKAQRDRGADAARGSGDQRDLAGEPSARCGRAYAQAR